LHKLRMSGARERHAWLVIPTLGLGPGFALSRR